MKMYPRHTRTATADRRPLHLSLATSTATRHTRVDREKSPSARSSSELDSAREEAAKWNARCALLLVVSTLRQEYGMADDGIRFFLDVLDSAFGWSEKWGAEWMNEARRRAYSAASAR